jgi:hypothetical protein
MTMIASLADIEQRFLQPFWMEGIKYKMVF